MLARGLQQAEEAVGLDVEDEVELLRLLLGELAADLDAAGVDAARRSGRASGGSRRRRPRSPVRRAGWPSATARAPPAASTDSIARSAASGALDRHDLPVDRDRRRLLALRARLLDQGQLQLLAILSQQGDVRVVLRRLGHQVEQVERAAARAGEVGHDRARDAAGGSGHHEHAVLAQLQAGPAVLRRALLERDRQAQAVVAADLDDAGIGQGLRHERLRHLGRRHARREVDDLHQRVGALALVGLGEAGDRPAERRRGALRRLAVQAAHARRGDQEGARGRDALVERAHRRVQVLHAAAVRLAEAREVQLRERRLDVERRQPEDARDRPSASQPAIRCRDLGRRARTGQRQDA